MLVELSPFAAHLSLGDGSGIHDPLRRAGDLEIFERTSKIGLATLAEGLEGLGLYATPAPPDTRTRGNRYARRCSTECRPIAIEPDLILAALCSRGESDDDGAGSDPSHSSSKRREVVDPADLGLCVTSLVLRRGLRREGKPYSEAVLIGRPVEAVAIESKQGVDGFPMPRASEYFDSSLCL
jgi:hypothetical protein